MHENNLSTAREHKVGFAWQAVIMQSVAITHGMSQTSDHNLGLGVGPTNTRHDLTTTN